MPTQSDDNEFSLCQSVGEVIFLADRMIGRDAALMMARLDPRRESLREAVAELRRGRADAGLIEAIEAIARAAPRDPRPLWSRSRKPGTWRTASGEICRQRRRAERRPKH
jgi:hypothetical protein